MLMNIELESWSQSITPANLSDEEWATLSSVWPLVDKIKRDSTEKHGWYHGAGPCRVSAEEAQTLVQLGLQVKVVPLPGAMITKMQGTASRQWSYGEEPAPSDLMSGAAVQVTVADMAILMINEVTWRDDCCTEEIQGLLNDGWRILAVCPPNAARRPDYILGRRRP